MIYFDQAATSYPKPPEVAKAMCQALSYAGNSGRGSHQLSLAASRLVYEARCELADFFGAEDPSRIAFTANATESLNLALFGSLNAGDHVITTETEHNSVLRPLYRLEERGVELSMLPADRKGAVDFTGLGDHLRPNTRAVVLTHASNVTGNLLDIESVGAFCRQHHLIFIVDAAQTAGFYLYDLKRSAIDILCFTGHKALYGPQGVGGIYVRPGIFLRPLKMGGSGIQTFSKTHPIQMPEALEAGTLNVPGIAGLLAGIRYLQEKGLDKLRQEEEELTNYFYAEVRKMPGVEVYGDFDAQHRCPIVALNITGLESSFVSQVLVDEYEICTRPGGHCAPLLHIALGTEKSGAVRFSFSHFNRKEELDLALEAIGDLARRDWGEFL
ncbi:MAG: aminotransferase class V-fold PLP-dependent enzyme [Firmicutes bacterium]|nr:aminotransferase class V-fold PLP-dependent enzyme [Bacillota bacterium]